MPYLKYITLPSGSVYTIRDPEAWSAIEELQQMIAGVMHFRGRTLTELYDGVTTSPITLADDPETPYTPQSGDVVTYTPSGSEHELEFAWTGNQWQEYGSSGALKALAFKDTASTTLNDYPYTASSSFTGTQETFDVTPAGTVSVSTATTVDKATTVAPAATGESTYTPSGSVSAPTISLSSAGSTTTIKNPTSQTVVYNIANGDPGESATGELFYCSVANETLTFRKFTKTMGASITTENVTVKNGDASYTSSAPTFTGDGVRLETDEIIVPESYTGSFTGTSHTIDYTPAGGVETTLNTGNKTVTVS